MILKGIWRKFGDAIFISAWAMIVVQRHPLWGFLGIIISPESMGRCERVLHFMGQGKYKSTMKAVKRAATKLQRIKTASYCCERVGPAQGSKSPKSGKEGFGVKKLPFPKAPEKGDLSRKIPISLQGSTRKMGIFRLKSPFSGAVGKWEFFDPETLFSRFSGL